MKPFSKFMKTGAAHAICDQCAVHEICNQSSKSSSMPFGRLTMQRLRAAYLSWVEAPEKTAKKG
jgi:hypothetical protein